MRRLLTILLLLAALSVGVSAKTEKSDIYDGDKLSAVIEAENSFRYTFITEENGLCVFTFENLVFAEGENVERKPRLDIVLSKDSKELSRVYYDAKEGEKLIVAEGLEPGEYNLTVTSGERFVSLKYDISFDFSQSDNVEAQPANTFSSALEMQTNEIYTGGVTTRENADFFSFELQEDGYALVGMHCFDAKTFTFYDGDGQVFDERSFYLTDTSRFHTQRIGLAKGKYYVSVENYEDYTDPVYSLWFRTESSDSFESENNNTKQNADEIKSGKEYKANLTSESDEDYYTFELDSKSNVSIDFRDSVSAESEHFRFTLLNDTEVLKHFDTYRSLEEKLTLEKGRYYFKVYCHNPKYYHGESYSLKVTAKALEQVQTPEEEVPERTEEDSSQPEMEVVLPAFSDVTPDDWFYNEVTEAHGIGLVKGKGDALFDPYGNVTLAELIAFASRLHAANNSVQVEFDESIGEKWYTVYTAYAVGMGMIGQDDFDNYERKATRSEAAYIIDGAIGLTADEAEKIAVPDVENGEKHADSIYRLYSLGIFKGADGDGRFFPQNNITRAEIAAVVLRCHNLKK